jgi:5-methylcytosine-specific restriction endonuclease McrA
MPNQYSGVGRNNRQKSISEGKKTYTGSTACKHWGSSEKYVSSYGCYPCNHKKGVEKLLDGACEGYMTKEKWAENRARRIEDIRNHNKKYSSSEKGKIVCVQKEARRRASLKNQTPDLTQEEVKRILTIYEDCSRISSETGVPHEVDHIIPICKGGLHHPDNLQILTMKENRKKGGK